MAMALNFQTIPHYAEPLEQWLEQLRIRLLRR